MTEFSLNISRNNDGPLVVNLQFIVPQKKLGALLNLEQFLPLLLQLIRKSEQQDFKGPPGGTA